MENKFELILNNLDNLDNLNSVINIYNKLNNKNKIFDIFKILEDDEEEKYNILNINNLVFEEDVNPEENTFVLSSILKIIEDNKEKLITLQFPNNSVISIHLFSDNYIMDLKSLEKEISQYVINYDTILSPIILVTREITNITIEERKINYINGFFINLNKKIKIERNDLKEMIDYNFDNNGLYHIIYQ